MTTLAICAIVRNEAANLPEWIGYHRLLGFRRFDIYDDYSTDDTVRVAIQCGANVIIWRESDYPSFICPEPCDFAATPQITAFNHWIFTHGNTPDLFCAFIDPDEYIYHHTLTDITPAIAQIPPKQSALWLQWLFFGSNDHKTRPPGYTIRAYTRRGELGQPDPYGLQGKIIARATDLRYFGPYGSHNAKYKTGRCIDEKGVIVPRTANISPSTNTWQLNHYYHRSDAEATAKLKMGDRNAVPPYIPTRERLDLCNRNEVEDTAILRIISQDY